MKTAFPGRMRSLLLRAATSVSAFWLAIAASPAVAWAQQEAAASGKSHTYTVMAYALVIFVVALGLMIVYRPAHRKEVEGAPVTGGWFAFATSEPKPKTPGQPIRKKPHRGVLLLILSILGWVVCLVFAMVAYTMANADLESMQTGRMDRSGEGLTKAAKIISAIALILSVLSILLAIIGMIIAVGISLGAT